MTNTLDDMDDTTVAIDSVYARLSGAPAIHALVDRDEWMLCMRQALAEQVTDPALHDAIERAFSDMAQHMVNTRDTRHAVGCPQ